MSNTTTAPERPTLTIEDLDGRATCSVKEAAEILGIHSWSADEAVKRGEIPALHIGKRILVPVPRLRALLGVDA
ncbi:helix-turn-helix domain-containing protein [Microbacterium sp. KUDC0406]|uniref:helix-turn-helix domain-containing protein n=1 Tax=Microbacterium sp. KUDC0406 TaxID=2909588 RepID=UPI001F39E64A|nr:helix-turn-helix domain-containing protein [Microbacterium sp. KUDC0406]UJP09539.1 helix-turn-helix domain-containing protein [Microbacterium sp. KUDC0406]